MKNSDTVAWWFVAGLCSEDTHTKGVIFTRRVCIAILPWEHAIVGDIAYSLFVHTVYWDSSTDRETLLVMFASLFRD